MKEIILNGTHLTPKAASCYLAVLKQEYEFHKDRTGKFNFGGQEILTSYAKYMIEYLENCLKKEE